VTVELHPGDPSPEFVLLPQDGDKMSLANFRDKKLLLYFYPKADTPGCTIQSCSVRDASQELAEAGITAIGISPDDPEDQLKFDKKFGLGFPLLSDPDHAIAEAYGVWREKTVYGKKKMGILRSAFLIDEGGILLGSWYSVKPEDTVPKALAAAQQ
jgi:peroxiredoxin Q/BCP